MAPLILVPDPPNMCPNPWFIRIRRSYVSSVNQRSFSICSFAPSKINWFIAASLWCVAAQCAPWLSHRMPSSPTSRAFRPGEPRPTWRYGTMGPRLDHGSHAWQMVVSQLFAVHFFGSLLLLAAQVLSKRHKAFLMQLFRTGWARGCQSCWVRWCLFTLGVVLFSKRPLQRIQTAFACHPNLQQTKLHLFTGGFEIPSDAAGVGVSWFAVASASLVAWFLLGMSTKETLQDHHSMMYQLGENPMSWRFGMVWVHPKFLSGLVSHRRQEQSSGDSAGPPRERQRDGDGEVPQTKPRA